MAVKHSNVNVTMSDLKVLVDTEFSKIKATVLCRYQNHVIRMKEWYSDVGVMCEEVDADFEETIKEAGGLEEDAVISEPSIGSDGESMSCSDDE